MKVMNGLARKELVGAISCPVKVMLVQSLLWHGVPVLFERVDEGFA
jgi:hypothetical protein